MSKASEYRAKLQGMAEWDPYLLAESGLPGPRGNLELAQAVADEGDIEIFLRYLTYSAEIAPVNSPYEFLAFCGIVGLGRLEAEGKYKSLSTLRQSASDVRWRIREAVAMAMQRLGDVNLDAMVAEVEQWSRGTPYEQRAAAASICEPRLLEQPQAAQAALNILDTITESFRFINDRRREDFLALRKGLGYCWSVAVAAFPSAGKPAMEKWLASDDPDVKWIVNENLKKNRLIKMDAVWVEHCRSLIGRQP